MFLVVVQNSLLRRYLILPPDMALLVTEKKMKRTNILTLFTILLACLFPAEYAATQSLSFVEIRNRSGEKRKICMYKDSDTVRMAPYKCFVINANESAVWNRNGNRSDFKVKVFKGAWVLHYRRVPGRMNRIVMGAGSGFGFNYVPPKGNQP